MGNIVMGISPDSPIQQDLFDLNVKQIQKMRRLDEVIDRINRIPAHRHRWLSPEWASNRP